LKVKAHVGIVKILKQEGIEWVSTFPSSGLNNALGEEDVLNLMMRTERFAVAVADGFSRVSNGKRFGVCTVQGGLNSVGLQMAYGGLAQAYEDSTPMLCITDGIQTPISGIKRYNIDRAFQNVTKWMGYINKPERISEFLTRAFTFLRSGRPGPVMIQIPRDLGEYDNSIYPYTPVKGWKYPGDPRDIKIAIRALLSAKKPVIYAGQGIFYADACEEFIEFVELVQVPVITTLKGKSVFPENHPLSLGVKGVAVERFLQTSDLIFAIGSSLSPGRKYGGFAHHIPNTSRSDIPISNNVKVIIQSTIDETDINQYYKVDHAIIGDAKLVLKQLIKEVNDYTGTSIKPRKDMIEEIEAAKKEHLEKYMPLMTSNERPINPYRVYHDLMETIDRNNSFVTHESGGTREQLATVYEALIPHGFMGWGRVSTLGFSLGAAVGAKLAYPDRCVVNVTGDAGIGYQLGNLEALVRNRIGITTIHINNSGFSGYGSGFWGHGRMPYTASVTSSSKINMANASEALGMHSIRVEDPDDIPSTLKEAFKMNRSGKPAYIEIICSQYPVWADWLV
jgi:acetolactate synthase-1/2/3 large subunit